MSTLADVRALTQDVFTARRIADCDLYEAKGTMAVAPALQAFMVYDVLKPTPERLGFWYVGQLYEYAAAFAEGDAEKCERIQNNMTTLCHNVAAMEVPN